MLLVVGASAQTVPAVGVHLLPLDRAANFPDAAAANAISQTCAEKLEILESYFAARNLPFEKELAHNGDGSRVCHVFYEPTLPGFRASRDNQRVHELHFAIDALTFLASGELPGGSLDVAKEVLPRLSRPVKVRMIVSGGFDKALWESSARLHFGNIPHDLTIFDSGSYDSQPWAQDHMKAGFVNGEERVLIPRLLFEGRPDNGEFYRSILDTLVGERIIRSKLSWEGGDLQFAASLRPTQAAPRLGAKIAGRSRKT